MNKKNKIITIGIPTYNEEKNIIKFFESLKKQNIESNSIDKILFVDDSEDNTPELINKLKIENPSL
jgi:glycosyltransferase involved in cell wall biosynthesis